MCAYILMRVFESAPSRYDLGINILTLGKINELYDYLTSFIKNEYMVLDIGCGTGLLTIRAALKGAIVKGIDINPQMLEIAKRKIVEIGVADRVKLLEMGVAELDKERSESYDVVMSGLCFSELNEYEIEYALKEIMRILKPGGLLLIADETTPRNRVKRLLHLLIRIPLSIFTYLITQTTTSTINDLPARVLKAGFKIEVIKLSQLEDFIILVARKPGEIHNEYDQVLIH